MKENEPQRLIHYSANKIESLIPITYDQCQERFKSKPLGFWFSVEGHYDWRYFCIEENFKLKDLLHEHQIILKKDANIIHLKNRHEILDFTKEFRVLSEDHYEYSDTYQIQWDKVSQKYQGIIIAPYQFSCRIDSECMWYYPWHCACGCIWDLDAIAEFKLLPTKTIFTIDPNGTVQMELISQYGGSMTCPTSVGRVVNMAEELTRIDTEMKNSSE